MVGVVGQASATYPKVAALLLQVPEIGRTVSTGTIQIGRTASAGATQIGWTADAGAT